MRAKFDNNRNGLRLMWLVCCVISLCLLPISTAFSCGKYAASLHPATVSCTAMSKGGYAKIAKSTAMKQCCVNFCMQPCIAAQTRLFFSGPIKPAYMTGHSAVAGIEPAPPLRPPLFS